MLYVLAKGHVTRDDEHSVTGLQNTQNTGTRQGSLTAHRTTDDGASAGTDSGGPCMHAREAFFNELEPTRTGSWAHSCQKFQSPIGGASIYLLLPSW